MYDLILNKEGVLYLQIYQHFTHLIEENVLKEGDKLPSYRQLAHDLGVSLNTIKAAYGQLFDEGYIIAKERCGFFVDKLNAYYLPGQVVHGQRLHLMEELDDDFEGFDFSPGRIDRRVLPRASLQKANQQAYTQLLATNFFLSSEEKKSGWIPLRNQIATYLYQHRGFAVSAKQVIICQGYLDGLSKVLSLIDMKGLGLEEPGYSAAYQLGLEEGMYFQIPIDKYGFSVADLEKTSANLAVVTPNHQFPTGIIMGIRRRQRLINWALRASDRYILEDDYDGDFRYRGKPIPALKTLDQDDRVIFSGTFSKTLGPFMNVSYLVLPRSLYLKWQRDDQGGELANLQQQMTLANFMAQGEFDHHLRRMRTYYDKKQKAVIGYLETYPGVELIGVDAGLFIVLRLDTNYWQQDVCPQWLLKHGLLIKRLDDYRRGHQSQVSGEWLLGFGQLTLEEIKEGLEHFFKLLKK